MSLFEFFSIFALLAAAPSLVSSQACRNVPGDPGFPTLEAWNALNSSISGRLASVVPSGQYCKDRGGCTDAEWKSSVFRESIPGAMNQVNWEWDYNSNPPQMCDRNTTGTCPQGNVPLYAVLAASAEDIQAGVSFANAYNLRIVIKASGHDYLGRSTAPNSLLISTYLLQDATFEDDFMVGDVNKGSVVTAGSGLPLNIFYKAAKEQGKIVVGGTAATVVAAGGYAQGAGHSALAPILGLAADNAQEFSIVTADGQLRTANENENEDLFWALRGGGAGSWGVIVSVTFTTYPTWNVTRSVIYLSATGTNETFGNIMYLHAQHIFDLDPLHAGQYFYATRPTSDSELTLHLTSYFTGATPDESKAIMKPLMDELVASGVEVLLEVYQDMIVNDAVYNPDDLVALPQFLGSRLIPESVYRDSPEAIGKMYTKLFEVGSKSVLGHLVAGGKVSENADIDMALNPAWRTAKTHIFLNNSWSGAAEEMPGVRDMFQTYQLPIMEEVVGKDAGSYSSEADPLEKNFKTTFYGPNYEKLLEIKRKYDPEGLFIVTGGVGSDEWDASGFCKVA